MFTADEFAAAQEAVGAAMQPTLTNPWPLLRAALGIETWVKHENHTPTGAFKVRGGLNYLARLMEDGTSPAGLISATRGNHGQSVPYAAAQHGLPVTIVVPRGNSREKNAAMKALGAELIEHGDVFDEARSHAEVLAVLRALLRERVCIRDLSTILETLSEASRYLLPIAILMFPGIMTGCRKFMPCMRVLQLQEMVILFQDSFRLRPYGMKPWLSPSVITC